MSGPTCARAAQSPSRERAIYIGAAPANAFQAFLSRRLNSSSTRVVVSSIREGSKPGVDAIVRSTSTVFHRFIFASP